ncbi:hypothetical protein T11_916, partial [Trichinella zimbabwensis]
LLSESSYLQFDFYASVVYKKNVSFTFKMTFADKMLKMRSGFSFFLLLVVMIIHNYSFYTCATINEQKLDENWKNNMLPGSMSRVQHDDEDLHEDIFINEASGGMEEFEIKDFYTTTTAATTTTNLHFNSATGKSNLFENQSTIRPVFKQQSTEASSVQKYDHQPRDEQQQMSTILIASIIVSCFVITALSVALIIYIAFRYRRRRARI